MRLTGSQAIVVWQLSHDEVVAECRADTPGPLGAAWQLTHRPACDDMPNTLLGAKVVPRPDPWLSANVPPAEMCGFSGAAAVTVVAVAAGVEALDAAATFAEAAVSLRAEACTALPPPPPTVSRGE